MTFGSGQRAFDGSYPGQRSAKRIIKKHRGRTSLRAGSMTASSLDLLMMEGLMVRSNWAVI